MRYLIVVLLCVSACAGSDAPAEKVAASESAVAQEGGPPSNCWRSAPEIVDLDLDSDEDADLDGIPDALGLVVARDIDVDAHPELVTLAAEQFAAESFPPETERPTTGMTCGVDRCGDCGGYACRGDAGWICVGFRAYRAVVCSISGIIRNHRCYG